MSVFDWILPPIFWLMPVLILLLVFPDNVDRELNGTDGFDNLTPEKRDPRFYFYRKLWVGVFIFFWMNGVFICGGGIAQGFMLPFHMATRGLIDLSKLGTLFEDIPLIFQCL